MDKKLLLLLTALVWIFGCTKDESWESDLSVVLDPAIEVSYDPVSDKTTVTAYATFSGDILRTRNIGFMCSPVNKFDNVMYSLVTENGEAGTDYTDYIDQAKKTDPFDVNVSVAGKNKMAIKFTNLAKDKKLYLKAYIFSGTETGIYSEQMLFVSSTQPFIEDQSDYTSESGITATTALLQAQVFSNGGVGVSEYGVYYGTTNEVKNKAVSTDMDKDGKFTLTLADLEGATKYYVSYFAKNTNGETKSEPVEFTTDEFTTPAVAFDAADPFPLVAPVLLDVVAVVSSFGNDPNAEYGIKYGTSAASLNDTAVGSGIDKDGKFKIRIKNLKASTEYYFAPYVKTKKETLVGAAMSKSTLAECAPIIETIALIQDVDFKSTTVTMKGNVLSDGGKTISEVGFKWGINGQQQNEETIPVSSIDKDGNFTKKLTGLTELTVYSFTAYAKNELGTSVNTDTELFTTGIPDKYIYQYAIDVTAQGPNGYDYRLNKDKNKNNIELHYYMLPEIAINGKYYIFLDRNLGATKQYERVDLRDPEAAGYYFKWGRPRHQLSPAETANDNVYTNSGPQLDNTKDATWLAANDPCPDGFHVPTKAEMNAVITNAPLTTHASVFSVLKLGYTGDYLGDNKPVVTPEESHLWTATFDGLGKTNANFLKASSVNVAIGSIGTKRVKPVRCVKIVSVP